LKPYERNPGKNDKAVDQIRASIREFGFAVPILAKSDGEVVDGHLRLKGAIAEKMREVPVIPCDGWTDAQVRAFRLMANRTSEFDLAMLIVNMTPASERPQITRFKVGPDVFAERRGVQPHDRRANGSRDDTSGVAPDGTRRSRSGLAGCKCPYGLRRVQAIEFGSVGEGQPKSSTPSVRTRSRARYRNARQKRSATIFPHKFPGRA
jgi:hypothetical protein